MSRNDSVIIVTRLWAWRPWFDSRQGLGNFPFATAFNPHMGPIHPPIQWVSAILFPGVNAAGAWSSI